MTKGVRSLVGYLSKKSLHYYPVTSIAVSKCACINRRSSLGKAAVTENEEGKTEGIPQHAKEKERKRKEQGDINRLRNVYGAD